MEKYYIIAAGAIILLFIVIILLGFISMSDKPERECETYIVEKGDTLWDISEKYTRGDKRRWIHEVCEINEKEGCGIYAGEVIYVFKEEE